MNKKRLNDEQIKMLAGNIAKDEYMKYLDRIRDLEKKYQEQDVLLIYYRSLAELFYNFFRIFLKSHLDMYQIVEKKYMDEKEFYGYVDDLLNDMKIQAYKLFDSEKK